MKESFTREDVISEARRRYGKPVTVDLIKEAMGEDTLNDAVTLILVDSVMWDSPSGNPMDEEIWKTIKE